MSIESKAWRQARNRLTSRQNAFLQKTYQLINNLANKAIIANSNQIAELIYGRIIACLCEKNKMN